MSKAFDKVWHDGLRYKILQQELPEIYEKILSSFLSNRTAQIEVNNAVSDKIQLLSGVPQGSILSPILFLSSE